MAPRCQASVVDRDEALDKLYAAPLESFTQTRNELAKELEGDAAAEFKKLKKPSVGAWAINQLAREHPDDVEHLLEIHQRMAEASGASQLRKAAGDRREAIAKLVTEARRTLERAGHNTGAATLEKVSQTLLAASGADERELVRSGRLTREFAGTGMDAFGLAPDSLDSPDETAEPTLRVPMKVQREVERLRRDAEAAEREAAQLAQEANFLAERSDRARTAAEEAERVATEARSKAEAAANDADL